MRKIKIIGLLLALCFLTGCGTEKEEIENPIVTMIIKDYGTIKMELYPNEVYNTVANFVTLVEDGFYDNNTFHRLSKGFVLQGGDPTGLGTEGPGYYIKGEFAKNGVTNKISHTKGVVSMARNTGYNTAGSQFFIMLSDNYTSLDGSYAAFGKVIDGWDVIEKIENANLELTNEQMGILKETLTIEKTTVDTKGHTYEVETIKKN